MTATLKARVARLEGKQAPPDLPHLWLELEDGTRADLLHGGLIFPDGGPGIPPQPERFDTHDIEDTRSTD